MPIPPHPDQDEDESTPTGSRRSAWIVVSVVAALVVMVALHLSGVITAH